MFFRALLLTIALSCGLAAQQDPAWTAPQEPFRIMGNVYYVGSEGHYLSVSGARWDKNNRLPHTMAALAGYNWNGTTATPCSPDTCGYGTGNTVLYP